MGTHLVNIAVLGCGHWGQNLVRNFQSLGVLSAICDPSEKGCARARELAPSVRIVDHPRELINDPAIQAVAIATPAETHYSLASQALAAGKDAFVEKPLAINYHEGVSLNEQAIGRARG